MLMLAVCGLAAGMAQAQSKLVVQVPAAYADAAPVVEPVRRQCAIESLVGNHIYTEVSQRVPGTAQAADATNGVDEHFLRLTIVQVRGVGGGSWSGGKSIRVNADLVQNGKELARTVLHRRSRGGAFGGFMGTCEIMERIAVVLGKDAAEWVQFALRNLATGAPVPPAPADADKSD